MVLREILMEMLCLGPKRAINFIMEPKDTIEKEETLLNEIEIDFKGI